jgi:hypothetical protein
MHETPPIAIHHPDLCTSTHTHDYIPWEIEQQKKTNERQVSSRWIMFLRSSQKDTLYIVEREEDYTKKSGSAHFQQMGLGSGSTHYLVYASFSRFASKNAPENAKTKERVKKCIEYRHSLWLL